MALCNENTIFETDDKILKLMQPSRDLYALKKRFAYLLAFLELVKAKFKRKPFRKPDFRAASLDRAFVEAIGYLQRLCFGPALEVLNNGSADDFEIFIKRLRNLAVNSEQTRQVIELKTLRNFRPCLEPNSILRVEGRLENADLPTDTKRPIILNSRHALTKESSTVWYVGTVRYASIFATKYGTLVQYAFFVMVRVRYVCTVRFF